MDDFSSQDGLAMINLYTKFGSLGELVMKVCMAVQSAENGVVRGHWRSWAVSPFDRAHTTAYSTFIEAMCLSCNVFEI